MTEKISPTSAERKFGRTEDLNVDVSWQRDKTLLCCLVARPVCVSRGRATV